MFGEFPGYKIERVLGRGATAQVFAATRASDGLLLALKVFHPGLWDQADLRRRAMGEFKTVSSLDHPNIMRVVEPLWENANPAVALEYVDGVSLEEFQARLPYILPEVAVLVLIEVLSALEYAHSRGVIHRDLKPANILISREGRVVVSDFGLAKMRDVSRLTLSGTVLGSPDYMSPEQARGDITTEKSDLFAAAAILYFLVTGTRPFSRRTPLATLAAVCEAEAEPASRRNPKLGPELARILSRGFAKLPEDRYASASELKATLQSYLLALGLSPESFSLPLWVQSPTETALEALKTITDHLILRAEKQSFGRAIRRIARNALASGSGGARECRVASPHGGTRRSPPRCAPSQDIAVGRKRRCTRDSAGRRRRIVVEADSAARTSRSPRRIVRSRNPCHTGRADPGRAAH